MGLPWAPSTSLHSFSPLLSHIPSLTISLHICHLKTQEQNSLLLTEPLLPLHFVALSGVVSARLNFLTSSSPCLVDNQQAAEAAVVKASLTPARCPGIRQLACPYSPPPPQGGHIQWLLGGSGSGSSPLSSDGLSLSPRGEVTYSQSSHICL